MKKQSSRAIGYNLLLINAFVYIASSAYGPYLSPYFTSRGINPIQLGVLFTIGPIASIFIQPFWAMISDRTGKRKHVLALVVLGTGLAMFSYYLGNTFLTYFIATLIVSIFLTAIIPLSDAIIINEASKTDFDFAKIRMGGTLGFSISVVLFGNLLKQKPDSLFFLSFLGYMVLLFFVLKLKTEDNGKLTTVKSKDLQNRINREGRRLREHSFHIFHSKMIFFVLAFAFISQLGLSFYWSFLGVYMVDMGYSQNTIGLINSVSALSEVPTLLFINRIIKKFGPMKILFASCIILSLRILLITQGSLTFILLAQLLQGISYMTIYFSCAVYINENVMPGKQSQGQSALTMIQTGLGSIIGNIAGGYLVDLMGIKSAYTFMSASILSTAIIIVAILAAYKRSTTQNLKSEEL